MFYEFLARRGVGMGAQLTHRRATSFGDHGGFLAGIAERQGIHRPTQLKQAKRRPPTLTDAEVQQILDTCDRVRDRLLMAMMLETGCRTGQALGFATRTSTATGGRLPCGRARTTPTRHGESRDPKEIPVRCTLLDVYTDYLCAEYGELDCDYVRVCEPVQRRGRHADGVLSGDEPGQAAAAAHGHRLSPHISSGTPTRPRSCGRVSG
ncbi:hypothetical protein OHA27_37610 [Streptomyces sp. NBC_01619]|uniref:hypothetical protein n=1 Tax=Streptomyces sp. NBC_01619 TaxID=2975901 RepID=UPI00224EC083|nr:hypothetical protein [Streptomyces sp. NBC_01619]MCX4515852.1 hypothetical protein [Streptomyces sp. NBC_01619]